MTVCDREGRDVMSLGQQGPAQEARVEHTDVVVLRKRAIEAWRASERTQLRARLRTVIVPGLEELADPGANPSDLIKLADLQARRLRAELEHDDDPRDIARVENPISRMRREEREFVRGHLHDTALQILEFIAGDGFGTGLSVAKISRLAGGAAHDLRLWIDTIGEPGTPELLPELELVTNEARLMDSRVELVIGEVGGSPTADQVTAIAGAVREAVTNARKHANATNVVVRVEISTAGQAAVTVTDDGVGIDPELVASANGLGVKGSIIGRMKRVGGSASLQDAPGGGTLVTLATRRQGG
jgi:anti-sigma regulatory factor (Ser/Thr protein kinase)